MRNLNKIDADIQVMTRLEILRELHKLEPNTGWNTAATGKRTLKIVLQRVRRENA